MMRALIARTIGLTASRGAARPICAYRLKSHLASSTWQQSPPSSRYLSSSGTRAEGPATVPLAAVEVRGDGEAVARYVQKADAAASLGLPVRDLREVDASFRTTRGALLPREQCIVVHLSHVRVIILPDSVLVFDPLNPHVERFVPLLQTRLCRRTHPMPFEFRALEAVFVEVCARLSKQLGGIVPAVDVVLDALASDSAADFGGGRVTTSLDRLLPLENALNDFADRVSAARGALHDVLASDVR